MRQSVGEPSGDLPIGEVRSSDSPRPLLRVADAVALTIGIVIGAGIFRTPSLVAANAGSKWFALGAWLLGGVVSLVGALCYAELATTYPHAGGDYHFLTRAFGSKLSFLFAWARMAIIQTGSIALLAFVFGDYFSQVLPLGGAYSSPLYAALIVIALTALNIAGIRQGTGAQNLLTIVEVLGVVLIIIVGLTLPAPVAQAASTTTTAAASSSAFGLVMVFVLFTYSGWNEASYVSAELRGDRRNIMRVLVISIAFLTALYVLVNFAYLRALGLAGTAQSEAVAADVMRLAFGDRGAALISVLIAISALTSANATVFTGARTNYALGRNFAPFAILGRWSRRADAPVNALVVQGLVALLLVILGAWTLEGFKAIVEYTAPVFWFFLLLTGVALFVLRRRDQTIVRPFRVPLYPLTPLVFCATSAYLLYSSLAYTGKGALIGVAVLCLGALILLIFNSRQMGEPTGDLKGDD
ncbi:MAG: amino acid permease [Pyrinomonadaceae bacterium]